MGKILFSPDYIFVKLMKILLTTRERFADGLFIFSHSEEKRKHNYESGTYVKKVPFIDSEVVKGEKVILIIHDISRTK